MIIKTDRNNPYALNANSQMQQKIYGAIIKLPFLPSNNKYNLTISHEKKFIWFRVAKVGTRSVLYHLKKLGINLDVEQASFIHYPLNLYSKYYKFAFVRNPWARLVSCWKDKVITQNHFNFDIVTYEKMKSFDHFIDFTSTLDVSKCERHLRLQSSLIDLNNIDYLGRLETFDEDMSNIFNVLGINHLEIEPLNVSLNKKPYQDYYSEHAISIVNQMYAKDIRLFGYQF